MQNGILILILKVKKKKYPIYAKIAMYMSSQVSPKNTMIVFPNEKCILKHKSP